MSLALTLPGPRRSEGGSSFFFAPVRDARRTAAWTPQTAMRRAPWSNEAPPQVGVDALRMWVMYQRRLFSRAGHGKARRTLTPEFGVRSDNTRMVR